jgi:hypothetical protein
LTIPVKSTNQKFHTPTPQWWNSSCTKAVKTRSLYFKMFRRTGCLSDLLKYRNVSAHTTRLLKNVKGNSWKNFCSNLNPSCSIQYLWAAARFKNWTRRYICNEMADGLAKSTSNTILLPLAKLPWTDLTPLLRHHIICLWSNYWNNLPAHFASKYKSIVPLISNKKNLVF